MRRVGIEMEISQTKTDQKTRKPSPSALACPCSLLDETGNQIGRPGNLVADPWDARI